MATLKDIRTRVTSVQNTQKITKAMKMVAASKLRRAQHNVVEARPYTREMTDMVSRVMDAGEDLEHPLLVPREPVRKIAILVFSSDRGLCGPFNGNLLRQVQAFYQKSLSEYEEVRLYLIGRKGQEFFKAREITAQRVETGIYDTVDYNYAFQFAQQLLGEYLEGTWDRIDLAYNGFKSAISQEVRIDPVFPVNPEVIKKSPEESETKGGDLNYLFEPQAAELLAGLVPRYFATQIYQAFLESMASEHGARMAAMDAATNNCGEMIRRLTLFMNRLRQATITRELIDIVNGAAAL